MKNKYYGFYIKPLVVVGVVPFLFMYWVMSTCINTFVIIFVTKTITVRTSTKLFIMLLILFCFISAKLLRANKPKNTAIINWATIDIETSVSDTIHSTPFSCSLSVSKNLNWAAFVARTAPSLNKFKIQNWDLYKKKV